MIYLFYALESLHVFFWKECLARGITQTSRIIQETISANICNILSATGAGILFNYRLLRGLKPSKKNTNYSLWEYIYTHIIYVFL